MTDRLLTENQSASGLRNLCGHDSRTVPGCAHCAVADEIDRLRLALAEELDWHLGIGPRALETVTERINTLRAALSGDSHG